MKNLLVIVLLLVSFEAFAQAATDTALTEGTKLLFGNNKSKLTTAEKNWLYKQLNFTVTTVEKNKNVFKSGEHIVTAQLYITDMNKDGIEEVFIIMQSPDLYGELGQSFMLFIKNGNGDFEYQSGLGNGMVMIIVSTDPGYPGIAIAGLGSEYPLFKWDGKAYKPSGKITYNDLQNDKVKYIDVAESNKLYLDTFK